MKISPIIFSTSMVQAILAGNKSMTRRIVKPQPDDDGLWDDTNLPRSLESTLKGWNGSVDETGESREWRCPYGQPGDILWVRETWRFILGKYDYKTDYPDRDFNIPWRPSIHMRKAAARLFLKITSIRVERLQEITEIDAIAEGVESFRPVPGDGPAETLYKHYLKDKWGPSPIHSFQTLWEKINGAESWESNPWVWVISFSRTDKPEKF